LLEFLKVLDHGNSFPGRLGGIASPGYEPGLKLIFSALHKKVNMNAAARNLP
jgi:hypothetical protein